MPIGASPEALVPPVTFRTDKVAPSVGAHVVEAGVVSGFPTGPGLCERATVFIVDGGLHSGQASGADLGIPGVVDAVLIGTGGSSRVYRAVQGQLGRPVAVKVLLGTAPTERKQFDRESKALGRMASHPGIVTVYDAGFTAQGDPYLLLEYCSGGALSDRLVDGVYSWQEAVGYLAPVAETLAHAHDQGYVHRDLKPGNILLDDGGRPLIADFGLARFIEADASVGQQSVAAFTPGYVPPETVGGEQATTASDVYSLGGTLYSLLTGLVPFVDTDAALNLVALARRIAEEPVPDLRPHGIPADVCDVIESAMAKDPNSRPSAAAFAQHLRAVGSDGAAVSGAAKVFPDMPHNSTIHLTDEQLAMPVQTIASGAVSGTSAPVPAGVTEAEAANHDAASAAEPAAESRRTRWSRKRTKEPKAQKEPKAVKEDRGDRNRERSAGKRLGRTRAILNGVLLGLVVLGLMVGGVVGYFYLTDQELPEVSFNTGAVTATAS